MTLEEILSDPKVHELKREIDKFAALKLAVEHRRAVEAFEAYMRALRLKAQKAPH